MRGRPPSARTVTVETFIDAQIETDQLDTLIDALVSQIKTQAATLAVVRTLTRRHRATLHAATGMAEVGA